MSFSGDLKKIIDNMVAPAGQPASNDQFGFGASQQYLIPDLRQGRGISVNPESLNQDKINQGYTPPDRTDPFSLSTSDIQSIVADRTSAFTTIDIQPYANVPPKTTARQWAGDIAVGSNIILNLTSVIGLYVGVYVSESLQLFPGGTTITAVLSSNSVQVSNPASGTILQQAINFTPPQYTPQNLLDTNSRIQLLSFLNISPAELLYFTNLLYGFGGVGQDYLGIQARTLEVDIIGNSFRMERLPSGSNGGVSTGSINSPVGAHINETAVSSLVPSGEAYVYPLIMNFFKFFTGCYIQFDSTQNPMFKAKPGEVYNLPYSKIFITFFIADPRYRAIVGRNAQITGLADERILRQNLHIWDGNMVVENQSFHPTPFSTTGSFNSNPTANTVQFLTGNYDSGLGLSGPGPGQGIGTTTNHGYGVMWITGISVGFYCGTGSNYPLVVTLNKCVYNRKSGGTSIKQIWSGLATPQNYNTSGYQSGTIQYTLSTPIRVVLAGFDAISSITTSAYAAGESGEVLYINSNNQNTQNVVFNYAIYGYAMGWVNFYAAAQTPDQYRPANASYAGVSTIATMPQNSYPMDVVLDGGRMV